MFKFLRNRVLITGVALVLTMPRACDNSPDGIKRDKIDPPDSKSARHASIHFESSDSHAWLRYTIQGSHKEELPLGLYSLRRYRVIDIWYAPKERLLIKAWAELDRSKGPDTGPEQRWISCLIEVDGKVPQGAKDSTRSVTALQQEIFCSART